VKNISALILVIAAAVVLFGQPVYAVWAAVIALVMAWILDPAAVRAGLRFGVILAIIFGACITAAVVAWADGFERGFVVGGMVLLRLLVLTASAAIVVRNVDVERILAATEKAGFDRLGLVLGLSLNTLPHLVEAAGDVWTAHTVRSRNNLDRLLRMPGLGVVLLAHTGRIAEEAAAAASLRGHSALTRPGGALSVPVRVVVVTGSGSSGKTETVILAADRLRGDGVPVAGFVQPGVWVDDQKVGFRVRDLATGEEASLATLSDRGGGDFGTRFEFDDEGFRLGAASLSRASAGAVVVVDELGPVELRGEGHMPGVRDALATPALRGAVIVVRRTLVPTLLDSLDLTDAVVVDVATEDHDAADRIVGALARHR
jgi:nucleoside-triphosphatase THEP1/energy-coupling factor transporter transmembrane protein EcfT